MSLVEDMKRQMDNAQSNYLMACSLELIDELKQKVTTFFTVNPDVLTFKIGVEHEHYSGPCLNISHCHTAGVIETYNALRVKDRFNYEIVSDTYTDKPDELTSIKDLNFHVWSHCKNPSHFKGGEDLESWIQSHEKGFIHVFPLSEKIYYSGIYFWRENADDPLKIELKQASEPED